MIIDAHAHLLAPDALYAMRSQLIATGGAHGKRPPKVTDEALSAQVEHNVGIMDAVGTDLQLISPRPFQQGHSMRPPRIVDWWIEANNDLIARTVAMRPDRFAGVAGLPFVPGEPVERVVPELNRAIEDLGFVGISLNPDPTEGTGSPPPLGDRYWYPLYERMVELDVPALVHSAACNNERETYSEHFITEESIAILSICRSTVFDDFPQLRLIVSHGGGSVPYQVGRWRAARRHPTLGEPDARPFDDDLRRFWFDSVLYNRESLELLFRIIGPDRVLFGTEKPGSGSSTDPTTGRDYDDLKPVIESIELLSDADKQAIFERNARAVFPRLDKVLGG